MPNTLKVMKERLDFYRSRARPAIYPTADEAANPDLRGGVWMSWRDDPTIPPTVDDFVYPFSYSDVSVDSAGKLLNKKLSRFLSDQITAPVKNTSTVVPTIEDIIINFDNSSEGTAQKASVATMATTATTPTTAATPTAAPTVSTATTPKTVPPAVAAVNADQPAAPKLAHGWKPTTPQSNVFHGNAVLRTQPLMSRFMQTEAPVPVNIKPVPLDVRANTPTTRPTVHQTTPPELSALKAAADKNQTRTDSLTPDQVKKLIGQTASRMSSEPWKPVVPVVPTEHVVKLKPVPVQQPAGAVPEALQDVLRRHGFTKHMSASHVHEVSKIAPKPRPFQRLQHKLKLPLSSRKRPEISIPEVMDIIEDDGAQGSGSKDVPAIFDIINAKQNVSKQSEASMYHKGSIATSKTPLSDLGSGMGVGLNKLPMGVSVFGALGDKLLKQPKEDDKSEKAKANDANSKAHKFIGHITLDGRHYYVVGTENEELDSVHTKVEGNRITLHLPKSGNINGQGDVTPGHSVAGKSKSRIDSPPAEHITNFADDSEDQPKRPDKNLAAHNVTAVATSNGTKCEKVVQLDTSDNAVVVSSVVIVVIASAMVVGVAVVAMVAVVARHCQNARS